MKRIERREGAGEREETEKDMSFYVTKKKRGREKREKRGMKAKRRDSTLDRGKKNKDECVY